MAVKYRLRQYKNSKSDDNGKYYAQAVMTDTSDLDTIAERIQRNCSMKKSDVLAVLTELIEVMKDELQTSHIVKLDGLGTFKIGIKGTFAESILAFNAAKNIAGYRVNFSPTYTLIKTGTSTDSEGNVTVNRAKVADLTEGISVEAY